jgi:hypothetical protein
MGVKSFLRISGLAVSIGVSALLAGCGSGSSSAVSPPPPPPPTAGISFSPTTLAAGQILSGSIAPMTLTVTSTGSIPLTISGTTISGADASSFTVTSNNCTAAISTGNTCQMVVTFKPTATGSYTATLNVTDNAPASPQTVALSGTAVTESNS